jgi:hypothetical protein
MHFYHLLIGACEHIVAYKSALSRVFNVSDVDDDLRESYAETVYKVILGGISVGN